MKTVSLPTRSRPPLTRHRLDEAKRTLSIADAWLALGLNGTPARACCSPFRDERNPSFSITPDGTLWHDFADGTGGDVVCFVKRATACDDAEAIRRVLSLAGIDASAHLPPLRLAPRPPAPPPPPKRDALRGLDLREPTVGELAKIQNVRRWPVFAGLEIANRRGLLRVADVPHRGSVFPAWILTDDARKTAQARRLDGEQWPGPDGRTFKSLSLRSDDDAPAGLADVVNADRRAVLLCEGEPDALAALTLAWLADAADRVGVLCLTGARRPIPPAVSSALTARRVRILRQNDQPAREASAAWASSLAAAGIACDVQPLDGLTRPDGQPAKDAADLLRDADLETIHPLAVALLRGL
jgi:CHC2 zinc finger